MQHLIKHTYIFLGYVQDVQVGLGAATLCDKGPGPSSKGKTTNEYSDKQEIVPLIQLNRSRRGLQESVSATDSNKHSKDPRLDPSAKEHSCKKLITEPSIVDDLEYSKNSQIQNGRNLSLFISRTPLLSLIRADILLLNVNAENKKDRERRAYTHGQRRVRTKEIYNFVCNISKKIEITYLDAYLTLHPWLIPSVCRICTQ